MTSTEKMVAQIEEIMSTAKFEDWKHNFRLNTELNRWRRSQISTTEFLKRLKNGLK